MFPLRINDPELACGTKKSPLCYLLNGDIPNIEKATPLVSKAIFISLIKRDEEKLLVVFFVINEKSFLTYSRNWLLFFEEGRNSTSIICLRQS